jgi:DNA-binding response OmpR family regulator
VKALIIDDDPDIREMLTVLLESRGFDAETAADGIDAMSLGADADVIILDLNMPVFDGERLVEYWSLTSPAILDRVIVLSGHSRFTAGRKVQAFAMVRKPFDPDHFLATVDECVRKRHG